MKYYKATITSEGTEGTTFAEEKLTELFRLVADELYKLKESSFLIADKFNEDDSELESAFVIVTGYEVKVCKATILGIERGAGFAQKIEHIFCDWGKDFLQAYGHHATGGDQHD